MPIEIKTESAAPVAPEPRDPKRAAWTGFKQRCPNCGEGRLYGKYLKVNAHCPVCDEALDLHRADDAPPYFTITVVAHIVVPLLLLVEQTYAPALWIHAALWLPLCLILSLLLLPRVKGALIGLQWAYRMHGFGAEEDLPVSEPKARAAGL
jgi:uncharacterized protein (DUF983 family)